MIVTTPITLDLGVGAPREVELRDSQVEVPNLIMPIVQSLQTTYNPIAAVADVQTGSFLARSTVVRAPSQIVLQTTFANLAKGLWELELHLKTFSDFAATVANPVSTHVLLSYQQASGHILASSFQVVGSTFQFVRYRFLFNAPATVILETPPTLAAQNLVAVASLNAIRIL